MPVRSEQGAPSPLSEVATCSCENHVTAERKQVLRIVARPDAMTDPGCCLSSLRTPNAEPHDRRSGPAEQTCEIGEYYAR
jgi:hypothetical protein